MAEWSMKLVCSFPPASCRSFDAIHLLVSLPIALSSRCLSHVGLGCASSYLVHKSLAILAVLAVLALLPVLAVVVVVDDDDDDDDFDAVSVGVMRSPNDPLWYSYHANHDRLRYYWFKVALCDSDDREGR